MMIHRNDVVAVVSSVAAAASIATSAGLGDAVDAIAPGYGKKVLALITLVSVVAMTVSRVLSNPSPTGTATVLDRATRADVTVPVVDPLPATPPEKGSL